jgi:histidine phosphotransferase ChpT
MEGTLNMVHSSAIGSTARTQGALAGSKGGNALAGGAARLPRDQDDVFIHLRVARLLCSRLCHDMAGASGAIHNGVELMSEEGGADPAALSLIAASSEHLNNRLAFFRAAFGLGGGADRLMTLDEAADLARGAIENNRVKLDWRSDPRGAGAEPTCFPADQVRLVLGLALLGADALPRGGTLRVRCGADASGLQVCVEAEGARAGLPENLLAAVEPDADPESLTSRTVHGYFVAALARRLGTSIHMQRAGAETVTLSAMQPPSRAHTIPFPAQAASL